MNGQTGNSFETVLGFKHTYQYAFPFLNLKLSNMITEGKKRGCADSFCVLDFDVGGWSEPPLNIGQVGLEHLRKSSTNLLEIY